MLFPRFYFSVSWVKLVAVVLSNYNGVPGCRCTISSNALRITVSSCPFSKVDAISNSAADESTFFNILQSTCIVPFNSGAHFSISISKSLRTKKPPARLLVLVPTS